MQEVYGWLLGHWAVRLLMFQAAKSAGITPLRLSFTGTLRVIRRAIPKFQRLQSQELPFLSWLTVEILDTLLPERVSRTNPRVVKTCIQVSLKKPRHRATPPEPILLFSLSSAQRSLK
ncbi:MAG: hypothetical protein N4J56_003932 [Chroococcidiopsis sp. SAG 2025]|nr:hypothetical protein [Chroococcidiopsis sp. SAG 2025]